MHTTHPLKDWRDGKKSNIKHQLSSDKNTTFLCITQKDVGQIQQWLEVAHGWTEGRGFQPSVHTCSNLLIKSLIIYSCV